MLRLLPDLRHCSSTTHDNTVYTTLPIYTRLLIVRARVRFPLPVSCRRESRNTADGVYAVYGVKATLLGLLHLQDWVEVVIWLYWGSASTGSCLSMRVPVKYCDKFLSTHPGCYSAQFPTWIGS